VFNVFSCIQGDAIEATANVENESFLASKLRINSCYSLGNYITVDARLYQRVVPHEVAIRLGQAASIKPIAGDDIPCYYFCFATFPMLATRRQKPRSERSYNVLQPLTGNIHNELTCI
jgi:hypothetical protein